MGNAAKKSNYSVEEYLDFQRTAVEKYEFLDGEVFAMAGGTKNHNRIVRNLSRLIENERYAGNHDCETFINDVRVSIESKTSYVYPDVFAVCGDPESDEMDDSSVTNAFW